MKLFKRSHDEGKDSGVTGYWLIEWKSVFSIVVLRFNPNHRENYHSHAFNALTWWLWGKATEEFVDKVKIIWTPSLFPKYTPKNNTHKYSVSKVSWAISFRGAWNTTWEEYAPSTDEVITLAQGHKEVERRKA